MTAPVERGARRPSGPKGEELKGAVVSGGRETRYRWRVRCAECGDWFRTNDADDRLCDGCRNPLRIHVGQGTSHNCPHDDMTIHRVQRLLEDDATDHSHLDHASERG